MHTLHIHHRPSHIGLISLTVGCRDEIKPKDQKVVEALIAKSLGGKGAASAAAAAGGKKGKGKRGAEAEAGKGKKKAKAEPTSPEDKQFAKDKAKYDKEMEYQWRIKNNLSQHCSKKELQLLLEHNGLPFKGAGAGGEQDLQRNAKEALCYGVALSPGAAGGCCDKATTLRYDPAQHKYVCGQLSDWGSCLYTSPADETHMDALEIPPSLAEHSYLGKFKFKFRERLRKPIDPSENLEQLKLQAVAAKYKAGSKAQKDALKLASQSVAGAPFADLVFCLATKDKDLAEKIEKLGGVIKSSVTKNCTHLIATETEYTEKAGKHAKMMKAAAALDTCKVVEAEWVDRTFEAKARKDEYNYRLDLSAEQKAERDERQSTWGRKKRKHGETQKLIIKGRSAVDPDAGEEHQRYMHVLDEGDTETGFPAIWDFMGNVADAHNNSNSFYGIQLLESDDKRRRRWFVFRKWGRVGTDIGNTRDEEFGSVDEAKARFEELYLDKTGNAWQSILDGATFTKKPGKHFPVDRALDAGDAGDSSKLATVKADARSKLDARVQDLMCLIFDVKLMEDSLREMEIDLKKMPLGQLKKSQIKSGYEVLSRIQEVLENEGLGAAARKQQLSDLSNHFYTVIPHDFGLGRIKIIESTDDLRAKITMIEALLDIEAAVTMLGGGGDDGASGPTAEVDKHYAKLHCDLKPVEKKSEAYKQLQKYVMNGARKSTGLSTICAFPWADRAGRFCAGRSPAGLASYEKFPRMQIKDIFEVEREGEAKRFEPQKPLGNRRMLWHGSRTSNFGGILHQGMRIAPPEAPKTGYRFGKGAYFADVIGKSASYCRTSGSDEILIMACDVALGEEWETKRDKYMDKAQPGSQCTHALGRYEPVPAGMVDDGSGCMLPLGAVQKTKVGKTSVNVNEFIVCESRHDRVCPLLLECPLLTPVAVAPQTTSTRCGFATCCG